MLLLSVCMKVNYCETDEAIDLINDFCGCMFVQASKNSSEMRDLASRICRDYLTGAWKTISASDLHIKRIR